MEKTIIQKISMHLSKVIVLKNAFTGETVTSGVLIRTDTEKKPITRPGGYYLFLNILEDELHIEIESLVFQYKKLTVKTDGGEEVEEVLLYPSSTYPVKSGATVVHGILEPEIMVRFYLETEEGKCRLLADYKKNENTISIFTKGKRKKDNMIWYLFDKEKNKGEFFYSHKSDQQGIHRLDKPLSGGYRKKNAVLYQADECPTDEKGRVFFIIDQLSAQKYKLVYSYDKKGKIVRNEIEIQGTEWNRIVEN